MIRVFTLIAGLAGATASSQFPEFSQQYLQRLGGAVDALEEVVADFDASAARAGLDRNAALAELAGTAFLDSRRVDMMASIARYEVLRDDLAALQGQGALMRAYHLPRFTDPQIAQAAWTTFQPALPLTLTGAVFAALGFVIASLGMAAFVKLITWPFRRRASAA